MSGLAEFSKYVLVFFLKCLYIYGYISYSIYFYGCGAGKYGKQGFILIYMSIYHNII